MKTRSGYVIITVFLAERHEALKATDFVDYLLRIGGLIDAPQQLSLHGAPLRLRCENELGFKMVKWITAIEFVAVFADLGAGQGGYNEDHEFYGYRMPIRVWRTGPRRVCRVCCDYHGAGAVPIRPVNT